MYAAVDIEFPAEWNPEQSYDNNEIPAIGLLGQNYPNPFNPETTISFSLSTENTSLHNATTWQAEDTEIIIYNMKGQKVKTLVNERFPAGQHSIVWDGTNDNHKKVSSGVYFYRMTAGDYTSTKKMILMK
ncbi:MAG: T9SS type A sorting domain-containing protein [Armatimonadetes bacterium]|nr:T9SS type A sorting domain-containing protein [Armatimonadota bacterium]